MLILASEKCLRASAVVTSKKVGCGSQSAARPLITVRPLATESLEIISPFTRIRSRNVTRCGEVNRPVRYPCARKIESIIAQTEPLPLVPATWTTLGVEALAAASAGRLTQMPLQHP